ncbi:MAG TPA: NFACT family protein [Planctomycetota bacterium]|nr:NFACT family protein [Planctomycetota bacterium]
MRIPLRDLKRAVEELKALRGRSIDNVYQCGPRTFLLRLKPETLLLDLAPNRARVLLTDAPPAVPEKPPVFGSILRSALRGGRIEEIALLGEDRVVAIDVSCDGRKRLVVEAFARHGNLLLLDADGTVVRVLDGDAARHRGTPVGATYGPPAPPKIPAEESLLPGDLPDEPFAANLALDRLARAEVGKAKEEVLEKAGEKAVERLRKAIGAVERDLREIPDPATLRKQGEALVSGYGDLRQGMKAFEGVPLDPRLTPQENVDRAFEAARKAERARPALEERLLELKGLLARAEAGEALPEVLPVSRKGRPPEPRKPYKVFRSADGRRILVGKGGKDNDETTLKVAGSNDLFLHTRGCPGAHVIVPLDRGEEVPEQTLLDAATLALHYSKMRTAAAAEITYTPRRNVSKPKGAKPGLVQVTHEKVLRLRREPERLARLLMSAE